jgi:hypothetical protein
VDIASIDPNGGTLTPSGGTFGKVKVTAAAAGLTATTTIEVALSASIEGAGLGTGGEGQLQGATTPDPSVKALAYPYDATVFPRGLLPPELMWNGGSAGDAYLIHLTAPSFDLSIYANADPPSRFTMPTNAWNALTTTAAGGTAHVQVKRLSGGAAYASAAETWTVADANLRGTIYYWAINEGQIIQIDLGKGTNGVVFDSGPNTTLGNPAPINSGSPASPPWEDNGAGKRCVACHSVSKDGSTLTSVFARAGSQGPLGFYDFASASVRAISDYTANGVFEAISPDGKVAVHNDGDKSMHVVDGTSGAAVSSALDALANVCDPTFSPDGTLFALAASCDPGFGYPVEYRTSNLVTYSFAEATKAFTNPQTIVTSTGIGDAIAFPSFTPDSKNIVFQRGDYSRAKYGTNSHGNDDLYIVPATAGATPIALDAANGKGVLVGDNVHLNYAPTVNPIAEGGYVWVVFTSPRDYGNRMVSPQQAPPNDASYANHKQLWVTAVDATLGTTDPSHPAFWLPGQDPTSINMFGYWALAPCLPTPTDGGAPPSCTAGFECCSGFCRDTGSGPVCTTQPAGCSHVGDKCTTSSDCCNAGTTIQCIGGICQQTAPK